MLHGSIIRCMTMDRHKHQPTRPREAIDEVLTRGRLAETDGDLQHAYALYNEALDMGHHDPEWRYRLGCVCLKLGSFAEARLHFQAGLVQRPRDARMLTNLGVALDRLGLRDEALTAYQRAVFQDDAPVAAYHNLGALYAEAGRIEDAIRAFSDAVRKAPDAEGYCSLGLARLAADDPVLAQESFECAVSCDQHYVRGHYYAAVCLLKCGRYQEALQRFEQALDLEPTLVRAHFHRGVCLHKLERFKPALAALSLAEAAFPEDSRVHFQLALTLDALGLTAEARRYYHQARLLREEAQLTQSTM